METPQAQTFTFHDSHWLIETQLIKEKLTHRFHLSKGKEKSNIHSLEDKAPSTWGKRFEGGPEGVRLPCFSPAWSGYPFLYWGVGWLWKQDYGSVVDELVLWKVLFSWWANEENVPQEWSSKGPSWALATPRSNPPPSSHLGGGGLNHLPTLQGVSGEGSQAQRTPPNGESQAGGGEDGWAQHGWGLMAGGQFQNLCPTKWI